MRTSVVLSLLVSLGLLTSSGAVFAGRGGPDGYGYTWIDSDEPEVVIKDPVPASPSSTMLANETLGPSVALPWSFPFYGAIYNSFQFSDNGWITFVPPAATGPAPAPRAIPDAANPPSQFMAPFWRDFVGTGNFAYHMYGPLSGETAYGIFMQNPLGSAQYAQTWVVLYPTGVIHFEYRFVAPTLVDANLSIGIESTGGTFGTSLMSLGVAAPGFAPRTAYAVEFFPPPALNCTGAEALPCNSTRSSASPPGPLPSNALSYACGPGTYTGNEKVFTVDVPVTSRFSARISNFGTRSLDVMLLSQCNEMVNCVAGGADSINVPYLRAGSYYLIVDAVTAADNGTFDIRVDCQPLVTQAACDTSEVGDTSPYLPIFPSYPCAAGVNFDGPEAFYQVTLAAPGNLAAGIASAPLMHVLIADAATFDLTNPACLAWGAQTVMAGGLPAGDYLVIVDGENAAAGPFTASFQCGPALDCSSSPLVNCFDTVNGDTTGGPRSAAIYSDRQAVFDGPERTYTFQSAAAGDFFAIIEGAAPELDLFLLDGCDESRVLAYGDAAIAERGLPAGTYTIVVDGRNGAAGPFSLTLFCGQQIIPVSVTATLRPTECVSEHKEVFIPGKIPEADIIFIMDLTGSMSGELLQLRNNIDAIATAIQTLIENPYFGLITHMDYTGTYGDCGYGLQGYGTAGDYPYRLDVPLTPDITLLRNQLATLAVANGQDAPESYSRALYEMYSDPAMGLRPDSQKIVIGVGDAIPHDCDVYSCIGAPGTSTGIDPGRDEISGTADDLAIDTVIQGMIDRCLTLVYMFSGDGASDLASWQCWSAVTGGQGYQINGDGSIPGGLDMADVIRDIVDSSTTVCSTLTLVPTAGYEPWMTTITPAQYTNLTVPARAVFDIELCPPAGTPPGVYSFEVEARCDMSQCGGSIVATQQVTITVPDTCAAMAEAGSVPPACVGDTVVLDGSASAVQACPAGLEYRWMNGAVEVCTWSSNPQCSVTPAGPTTYTLEIRCATDGACSSHDDMTVNVVSAPQPNAGTAFEICRGDSILLDGSATADPGCPGGLEYRWMNGAVEVCTWSTNSQCSQTPAASGTYTIETRCAGLQQCDGADSTTVRVVEPPRAAAGPDQLICQGDPAQLDGSATADPGCPGGLEFRWLDGAVEVCTWSPSAACTVSPAVAATYTIETRCLALAHCASSDPVTISLRNCQTPVRYGSYGARRLGEGQVEISWTTLSEIDTLLFQVEASAAPSGAARTVGYAPARGGGQTYAVTFQEPGAEHLWFRVVELTTAGERGDTTPAFQVQSTVNRSRSRSSRGARTP